MNNLRIKAEFQNRIVERKSTKTSSLIKVDTSTIPADKYQAYYEIGFADIFEQATSEETPKPKAKTKKAKIN